MLPGDRLVVALVKPYQVGDRFIDWPLHVTVVPWFRLNNKPERIAKGLTKALTPIKPFDVIMNQTAWFGPKKNRQAHLIELPTPFSEIEKRVRNYFHKKRAWLVDETTKKRRDFRPHVTVQKSNQLRVGDSFKIDCLYLVEQRGSQKEIVAEIKLG